MNAYNLDRIKKETVGNPNFTNIKIFHDTNLDHSIFMDELEERELGTPSGKIFKNYSMICIQGVESNTKVS